MKIYWKEFSAFLVWELLWWEKCIILTIIFYTQGYGDVRRMHSTASNGVNIFETLCRYLIIDERIEKVKYIIRTKICSYLIFCYYIV